MKMIYEEYSDDRNCRFLIYDNEKYLSVVAEQYFDEYEIEDYIEPAGYREVRDGMLHHVGTLKEGIAVGRELLRSL